VHCPAERFIITGALSWGLTLVDARHPGKVMAKQRPRIGAYTAFLDWRWPLQPGLDRFHELCS
jgi:hypothetical protein